VVLGSVFSFLVILTILGALMTVLPFRAFRKSSLYVRFAIVMVLMTVLATSFAVPPLIQALADRPHSFVRFLPTVWFLALCRSLLGRADPSLSALSLTALAATCIALVCAIGSYAFSYHRCYRRGSETMASLSSGGGAVAPGIFAVLDRIILRSPFERACFRFTIKALARGANQALVLGWFVGLGIVIASQTLFTAISATAHVIDRFPSAEILSIPLTLAYFLILGLRCAFGIPVALRANWLFRFTVNPETRECPVLARNVIFAFLLPALILICFPGYACFWGWQTSLVHTTIVAAMCILLTEISVMGLRKIPFTSSVPTFKSHAIAATLISMLGFFAFSTFTATGERWALDHPLRFLVFAPLLPGAWLALREWRKSLTYLDKRIIFEEKSSPAVEVMNLSYGP
jgi:hypothetical protein